MFKLFNIDRLLYSPDAPPSGSGDIFDKQDIFDALNDDTDTGKPEKDEVIDLEIDEEDDKEPEDKKSDKKDKSDKGKDKKDEKDKDDVETETDDDLKKLEEELAEDEEPDETKLELVTPVRRKQILSKYPKLFEDFPYLERAYYREQKFSEYFPTLDDAKETKEKAETLDNFEQDLVAGNTEKILQAAKQGNPQGFNKLVDNYLTTLQKVDEKAYTHVIGNVISHTIYAMVQEARDSKNESLQNAAHILNQYIFGSTKYVPPSKLATEEKVDPGRDELEKEKRAFKQEKYNIASTELKTKVGNLLKSTINSHIDPKNSMPPYVRKNAEREAYEHVNELLVKDTRFRAIVDGLWEKAEKANFSPDTMANLRKAFLGRGKTLLPTAIKKARLEALKGMRMDTKPNNDDTDDNNKVEKTQRNNTGKSRPNSGDKKDKFAGMSTL
jgi:hypothetical protein